MTSTWSLPTALQHTTGEWPESEGGSGGDQGQRSMGYDLL